MKKLLTAIITGLFFTINVALAQQTAVVTVMVNGIKQTTGKIHVAVFDNKENFKNSIPLKTAVKKVNSSRVKLFFTLSVDKQYSIALFQDLNNNDSLDTRGSMKIPVEPFGFSNNKTGAFGPPSFKKTAFFVTHDTTLSINIVTDKSRYLVPIKKHQ